MILLSLFLISLCSANVLRHPSTAVKDQISNRLQENAKAVPFRVVADYSKLVTDNDEQKTYISQVLMPAVVDYFTSALKLKYPLTNKISLDDANPELLEKCTDNFPDQLFQEGYEADLVFIVEKFYVETPEVANGISCVIDKGSKRTTIAKAQFNLFNIKTFLTRKLMEDVIISV
jgi:hypothetical protein